MKTKTSYRSKVQANIIGLVKLIAYRVFRIYLLITRQRIKVEPIEKSIQIILEDHLSIARFGDGEFKWMFKERESDNFERNSDALAAALQSVIQTNREGFKVCIPDVFDGLSQYRRQSGLFWAGQFGHHGYRWIHMLDPKRVYFDSLVTRPYMIYEDRSQGERLFRVIKQIWDKRTVILVEGSETRFGIGNDLLANSLEVRRVICPAENAFEEYDKILKTVMRVLKNVNDPDALVLISLGPTATILANDINLRTKMQVLDIGHLDLEYSWMLMKADEKVPVDYKYVNEVIGGNIVQELPLSLLDQYRQEIEVEVK
ncbi:GT-D fold domain-containing glycosyltransferase [Lacticaseibacillus paracasei]|uniref:GT-D fold domain-containing glycosyltransferase n=1 Tax=Lacticaseibacillus paracasei TaxID=1597 RepID=UPI003DA98AC5